MSEIDFSMNESLNRFLGITEKDINETNNMIKNSEIIFKRQNKTFEIYKRLWNKI